MNQPRQKTTQNQVVLITGAAHRIGRAIALSFAGQGWKIGLHHRHSQEAAQALADEIFTRGGAAAILAADLSRPDEARGLIPRCIEALGVPSCLVNNASLFQKDDLATLDEASWQAHMDVNLRAPVLLAQSFAAHLPAGASGHIVNIIDQRVTRPAPEFFSYAASKAGLWWVTQTMAQALAPAIRVNAVAPGPVLQSIHQTEAEFEAERAATLLGHGAAPEEIAAAIHFLQNSPSITGQMICVDAGQHLS
ncbi:MULTISPECIES: SDR family oxidoreductase [Rhodomicrobium]|uniref:SDR family oxidoreductase n=1 Tax=Rhodomicrobium TaxID=1068 RepID=UPI000B4AD395|nr:MULTISPECIES: SDR family oxidoreductase [Rhodomicrobium]